MPAMAGTSVTRAPDPVLVDKIGEDPRLSPRWVVVVWNDPVNLMTYVTYVFRKLFGYSEPKAHSLMLQVHHEGRAVVSGGTMERCEHDAARLHAHGLWATIQQD
jgi:ATP-dependent Clp protease adaptor protein ClpS